MQGLYPGNVYNPQQCRFWPSVFRRGGYATGMIGKWHTGFDTGYGRDWDYQAVWNHVDPKRFGGYYRNQKVSFNGGPPEDVGGYSTDNYTRWAIEFIRGEHRPADNRGHSLRRVHGPISPPSGTGTNTPTFHPCRSPKTSTRPGRRNRSICTSTASGRRQTTGGPR